jgi:hypothetical protein
MYQSLEMELVVKSSTGPEARFDALLGQREREEWEKQEREWEESLLQHYRQQVLLESQNSKSTEEKEELLRKNGMLTRDVEDLRVKNSELLRYFEQHLPHRQIFRASLLFLLFFSSALTAQILFGLQAIRPGLGWAGLGVSAGAAVLSHLAELDWKDWQSEGKPAQRLGWPTSRNTRG